MLLEGIRLLECWKPGVYEKNEINFGEIFGEILSKNFNGELGAVAIFLGKVKSVGKDGKIVSYLEIESYKQHADTTLQKICDEVKVRYGLSFAGVWHLIGRFEVGEPLVLVVASGRSRSQVFRALGELVERYKREPAIFKKEVYVDGSYTWIEE